MKLILETTGEFQIYAPVPEQHVPHNRPAVVTQSQLMSSRIGTGALKVLGQVNDDATDDAFQDALASAKGDADLAVAAFVAEFPTEKVEKPAKPVKGATTAPAAPAPAAEKAE